MTVDLIELASASDRDQMSRSASSSRKRRGRLDVDIDDNLEFLKRRLLQIREAIQLQYVKLNELQSQERALKEQQPQV